MTKYYKFRLDIWEIVIGENGGILGGKLVGSREITEEASTLADAKNLAWKNALHSMTTHYFYTLDIVE